MVRLVNFCYNPTSWNDDADEPWPGGMADALVRPILDHLSVRYQIAPAPVDGAVNVYYAHRNKYHPQRGRTERSVFVSHGIADKAWRNGYRIAREYDFIFVSGPAWSAKGLNERIPPHKIVEAGYTKLDPLFGADVPKPVRDRRIRVVWAPTHGGGGERNFGGEHKPVGGTGRFSSHHYQDEIMSLLPADEFDVVVAHHPRHRPDRRSTLTEYVGADVVIADGGSTIYEAWALGLPVVFPRWLVPDQVRSTTPTFESVIYSQLIGYHVIDPAEFTAAIRTAASNGITDREVDYVERILPARYRGESGRMHAEALEDIARHRPVRHLARFQPVWFTSPEDADRIVKTFVGSSVDKRLTAVGEPTWYREVQDE